MYLYCTRTVAACMFFTQPGVNGVDLSGVAGITHVTTSSCASRVTGGGEFEQSVVVLLLRWERPALERRRLSPRTGSPTAASLYDTVSADDSVGAGDQGWRDGAQVEDEGIPVSVRSQL